MKSGPIVGGHARNNAPEVYNGRKYASRMEARYAMRLDAEQRLGLVVSWEAQVRLPLLVPQESGEPVQVGVYVVDFMVHRPGGTEAVETKGYWTREARFKRRVFEATWLARHPGIRYRVIVKVHEDGTAVDESIPGSARASRSSIPVRPGGERPARGGSNPQRGLDGRSAARGAATTRVVRRVLSAAEGRDLLRSLGGRR